MQTRERKAEFILYLQATQATLRIIIDGLQEKKIPDANPDGAVKGQQGDVQRFHDASWVGEYIAIFAEFYRRALLNFAEGNDDEVPAT